ncbi:tyrosine-type recombinase/integrase [Bartonella sp. HY329]|uniref:tyrosine-type recombinase/integrase n=1 Tax=unclassified Bartonella TaxID=2645622 RepID=UPI0021C9D9A5|nr:MULTISPECIES: tyrosine-type recombinase/integrase [unclassified Bartonella]UXM94026.1 tyrosine-type recombinase/integrase [Bartonella sp. HY329]UXN08348.1 tyrosine-type recombinase/integrase [Bartonella sp. HY328]
MSHNMFEKSMTVGARATNQDRYLMLRNGNYVYKRRVPKTIIDLDKRSPIIQTALHTSYLIIARAKRDIHEKADNALWAALMLGTDNLQAMEQYNVAVRQAEAFGFAYKTAGDLAKASLEEIISRFSALTEKPMPTQIAQSLLGKYAAPQNSLQAAEKLYFSDIVPHTLTGKSQGQKERWLKERRATLRLFRDAVGDKEISQVTREDALLFYRKLSESVVPKDRKPSHSASWGNRQIGNARVFLSSYFSHLGQQDYNNPLANLSFKEVKKSRPPFSINWIKSKIYQPSALAKLNDEARHVVFILADTGTRLGEICNLGDENIHLDGEVPFIEIAPRIDPADPREIKTNSSVRRIPLIGLALEAIKLHHNGFTRYRDKETTLSNTLNKFFRENGLFENENQVIYSFRHAFEDRMKEADVDHELRMALMGHANSRPRYGSGGGLWWQWEQLNRIALPFDPSIL